MVASTPYVGWRRLLSRMLPAVPPTGPKPINQANRRIAATIRVNCPVPSSEDQSSAGVVSALDIAGLGVSRREEGESEWLGINGPVMLSRPCNCDTAT